MGSTNYNQVIYHYISVLLWNKWHFKNKYTTLSHWLFFSSSKSGINLVIWTLIQVKVTVSSLDQHPWTIVWNPMDLYSRWNFCGVHFLSLYMAYLGRVRQTFSELFNRELVLSLYGGRKILEGSLEVSWCTNHVTANIKLTFTMLECPANQTLWCHWS